MNPTHRIPYSVLLLLAVAARAAVPSLVWSDEFNQPDGAAPDPAKWGYDLGRGNPVGWGNQELESYTDSRGNSLVVSDPAATDGKALAIRAQTSAAGYTSARLLTKGTFTFTYGRMEARARIPAGRGLWPAFWALGKSIDTVSWPACGEIDVMEWVGPVMGNGVTSGSLHAPGYSGANGLTARYLLPDGATFSDGYHVFAVDWYPDQVVYSVDGAVFQNRKRSEIPAGGAWPFDQPFFLLINLAVGGSWPGAPDAATVFPADFRVDYVRVYSLPSAPPTGLVYAPAAPTSFAAGNTHPGQIDLSWSTPTDTFGAPLSGYRLERATDAAFTQNLLVRTLGASTSFSDKGLVAGRTYYYRVAAVTANGTSDPTTAVTSEVAVTEGNLRFVNLSTRAYVGTGDNVAIVGFVLQGDGVHRVLVRAVGPALAAYGIGTPLADPILTLFDQLTGAVIVRNDDWNSNGNAVATRAAATATGAFSLPEGGRDAAVVVDLPAGIYTAVVEGKGGGTGTALVEAYETLSAVH